MQGRSQFALASSNASKADEADRIPVLAALRERTREVHLALERRLEVALPDAGQPQYARYVAAMLGWMQPIEATLWQRQHWPAGIDTRSRAQKSWWLRIDIEVARAAGIKVPEISPGPVPECISMAARYGQAYVIEGSMLGGAYLLRRLGARLAPWPARYLQGYGAARARYWQEFLFVLGQSVTASEDIDDAARSAHATFVSIAGWLQAHGATA
jgi:heme oxygenase